jgi:hypothetical protein
VSENNEIDRRHPDGIHGDHGSAEPAAELIPEPVSGDPKASSTFVVLAIGALLILVIVIALQAFYYNSDEEERAGKITAQVPEELARLRNQELEQLNGYRWVDQARGVASIPIDRAMELVVREQGGQPAAGLVPASGPTTTGRTGK